MVPSTGLKKAPCVPWKMFQEQLPTTDQLRQWGCKFKPARWGLVTGKLAGVVVVDFDGDQGRALMQKWAIKPHVRTGSGGFHWYLGHPGWYVPTLNAKTGKQSWRWPGVDIRGDGGFAVLLGRNSNGEYEQLRELVPEPFEVLPSEVRTFLHNHATQGRLIMNPPTSSRVDRIDSNRLVENALAMASSTGRNNSGFWLACQLRDNEYSSSDAKVALLDYRSRTPSTNVKGGVEPYTESEIDASLREAYSRPARRPWERKRNRPHKDPRPTAPAATEPGRSDDDIRPSHRDKSEQRDNANDPEYLGLHVGHTGVPVVVHAGVPLSRTRFAK